MRKHSRRLAAFVALLAVLVLAGADTASATRGLVTGFADFSYESPDAGVRSGLFSRTTDSGAGIVRLVLPWRSIARVPPVDPSNPGSIAYDFSSVDAAVRDARTRGLSVMLTVMGAPDWAEGAGRPATANPGTWKPNTAALASFMRAATARYSGGFDPDGPGPAAPLPTVQAVQIWNEPNLPEYLTPQPNSPDYYRQMLNASYAAVKSVNPRMLVVTAGMSPYGGPLPTGARVRPVAFDRELLCVTPVRKKTKNKKKGKPRKKGSKLVRSAGCPAPASFDVLAHHPINTSGPPTQHAFNGDDAASADLGRITRVLRAAERAHTVSGGKHPIWATEIWWDSNPPNSAGSPLARQARWLEQALYLAWRDGASTVVNLLVQDANNAEQTLHNGNGSGIYFADGRPKPSATAFRFPLVADRINRGRLRVWGKSPEAGKLKIQKRSRRGWATVHKLRVGPGAVFTANLRLRGKQRLRATVAGTRSLVWKQR
jgi:hypothetical protein